MEIMFGRDKKQVVTFVPKTQAGFEFKLSVLAIDLVVTINKTSCYICQFTLLNYKCNSVK
jgi:hypothetical protein